MLSLAGMLLEAELPSNVRAGEELRLQVRELTPEKVVLAIKDESQPPPAMPSSRRACRLPGGGLREGEPNVMPAARLPPATRLTR